MMPVQAWYVNLRMRRVELVRKESSPYETLEYAKYGGPKRTYMLWRDQIFTTEARALFILASRMQDLIDERYIALCKLKNELEAVLAARDALT